MPVPAGATPLDEPLDAVKAFDATDAHLADASLAAI
jgi:hypothetical protein